jgi:hypothetical protein
MVLHTGPWIDAQAMAVEHPDTFNAPTREELDQVQKGHVVKICDAKERFWVKVKSRQGDLLVGLVNNELLNGQPYARLDTPISFELRHIYAIDSPNDIEAKSAMLYMLLKLGLSPEEAIRMMPQ